MTSLIWDNCTLPGDKDGNTKAKCKYCKAKISCFKNATSNLNHHEIKTDGFFLCNVAVSSLDTFPQVWLPCDSYEEM